jgi:hypothetical protein
MVLLVPAVPATESTDSGFDYLASGSGAIDPYANNPPMPVYNPDEPEPEKERIPPPPEPEQYEQEIMESQQDVSADMTVEEEDPPVASEPDNPDLNDPQEKAKNDPQGKGFLKNLLRKIK